jgi:hypothetical protein
MGDKCNVFTLASNLSVENTDACFQPRLLMVVVSSYLDVEIRYGFTAISDAQEICFQIYNYSPYN